MTDRHDAPSPRAVSSRAWRLADDLLGLSELLEKGGRGAEARDLFWQADHLYSLAETGDISRDSEIEMRLKHGLEVL